MLISNTKNNAKVAMIGTNNNDINNFCLKLNTQLQNLKSLLGRLYRQR